MAATMTKQQAASILKKLGYDNAGRAFTTALKGFQRGWNLGPALPTTGQLDQKTKDALAKSFARHQKGQSTMSAHFSYVEFRCKDGGAFPECQRIWMLRSHVRRLEAYRAKIGKPVRIVSGCRCKRRNQQVGGAKASQHLFGAASDIEGLASLSAKEQMRLFAGLGFKKSTGRVVHVDSRDVSGHNTTGGSPKSPTEWRYAS